MRTLRRYKSRPFYDILEIPLGCAVLLALRRPAGNINSVHLPPPHLSASEGHAGTFNTDEALDNLQPRTDVHHPPHESEVATRHSFGWPQLDYHILNG